MKTKLPFLFLFLPVLFFAQAPINEFFSVPMSSYAIVESNPAIDQSTSGASLVWDFTNLTTLGINTDTYAVPTASELATYPGTTEVLTVTTSGTMEENNIFAKDIAGAFSFTGVSNAGFELNYNTNNAFLGTFPLSYLDTTSDAVAGSFTSDSGSGTFAGTITTTVDAHGTLNMNDLGEGAFSGSVTRLKIVQDLTLSVSIFTGTVFQTSYYYYDNSNGNLVFRSNTADIEFAIVGIDDTITLMESFLTNSLSTPNNTLVTNEFSVAPNPVIDILNIKFNPANTIQSIRVSDINGRIILSSIGASKSVDVSGLKSGLYIVSVQTKNGFITKKFIKK
ncbi:T9SS type A sorting domain-containing protein [Xanthomarina spongicola]|uniref:Putative secreted protein (Por secretion system target) n=1 Tax=Xanthomarina spongicola TaxID=570520 RepID=A0A316DHK8_9FLAO|nr:T9SS type A sorting domain-containing protein [Xanthomarina spongicola]PWK17747.1 putative secreted protein (Por secretion system target) [Xanthomarina spongicola]